jgi:hypothetical protein
VFDALIELGVTFCGSVNMPSESQKSALEEVVELLGRHGVEFIVIGGQAEVLHGGGRVTLDIDLCYRRSAENLQRLAAALRELEPTLRGAPPDLPFQIDAKALALGSNFTFDTKLGDVDFLGDVEPLGGYDQLIGNSDRYRLGGCEFPVIALDDLIRIKQHIGRPKDRDSLRELLAIKQRRLAQGEK